MADNSKNFSTSVNPFGMPDLIYKAVNESIEYFTAAPDEYIKQFTAAISEKEKISEENIVCSCGGEDILFKLLSVIKPRNALIVAPCLFTYHNIFKLSECKADFYTSSEQNDFWLTEEIFDSISDETDVIFLSSPNNITGAAVSAEMIRKLSEKCEETNTFIIIDASLGGFSNEYYFDISSEKVIVFRDLSDYYSLAGLKIGYAFSGNIGLISKLCTLPCGLNIPALAAAVGALYDRGFEEWTQKCIFRERKYLSDCLSNLSFQVLPSAADFLLVKTPICIYDILEKKGFEILKCDNIPGLGENYYRITVRDHEDNSHLVFALGRGVFEFLRKNENFFSELIDPYI